MTRTYPATNSIVQTQAAERAGLVGQTEVNGDGETRWVLTARTALKLEAFARRLRLLGNTRGTTHIGAVSYEIESNPFHAGFTLLAVNGKRLEEA